MLPGLTPFLIGSAGYQFTVVGHTLNSGTVNFTYPSGIQSGDIAIAIDSSINDDGALPSSVTPSGFTSKMNETVSGLVTSEIPPKNLYARVIVSTRKFTSAVSGNVTGMSYTFQSRKTMLVLRPNWDVSIGASAERSFSGSTGNISNKTVAATAFSEPYIALGFKHTDNSGNITSSITSDYEIVPSTTAGSLYKWFLNSGEKQDIIYDIGDDGQWNFFGILGIQLS